MEFLISCLTTLIKHLRYIFSEAIDCVIIPLGTVSLFSSMQNIIAFPYRQNGLLVGCKYRTLEKKFWQVFPFFGYSNEW